MAGYIMTLSASESEIARQTGTTINEKKKKAKYQKYLDIVNEGIYATLIKNTRTKTVVEADFLGMKPGDNIYFFFDCNIYGVGTIKSFGRDATVFKNDSENQVKELLSPELFPFIISFESDPIFFRKGVDTDDILNASPDTVYALRFFQKKSFIHLDDEENHIIKSILIYKNENAILTKDSTQICNQANLESNYRKLKNLILQYTSIYKLNGYDYFIEGLNSQGVINNETRIEGKILDSVKYPDNIFGKIDFLSRQYPASPTKPSEYINKMDLFRYRYIKGFENERIVSKYIIMELKTKEINQDAILQTMKYVDWVVKKYAHGDYSRVKAYVVGKNLSGSMIDYNKDITRYYISSTNHRTDSQGIDVITEEWNDMNFVSYSDILSNYKNKLD